MFDVISSCHQIYCSQTSNGLGKKYLCKIVRIIFLTSMLILGVTFFKLLGIFPLKDINKCWPAIVLYLLKSFYNIKKSIYKNYYTGVSFLKITQSKNLEKKSYVGGTVMYSMCLLYHHVRTFSASLTSSTEILSTIHFCSNCKYIYILKFLILNPAQNL